MGKGRDSLEGKHFGLLTALEPTGERKNGYTVWRCSCSCGKEALVPSRYLKNGWATDCGCRPKQKRRQDLTGQRFGRLTVLEDTGKYDAQGRCIWRCRCDCGNEVETVSTQLTAGYKKSCGCLGKPPLKDWVGKRFGTLEVVSYAGKRNGSHYWHCRCHCGCGRELDVRQSSLQGGHTKGCGTLDRNAVKDYAGRKFGDLTVLSYAGKEHGAHYWNCRCACGQEIKVRQGNLQNGHTRSCGCRSDPTRHLHFVDGTCVESLRSKKLFANNTSGVRGVYWDKRRGMWVAQITFQGKVRYLGSYFRLDDAAKARTRAEELFDDFLEKYDSGYYGKEEGYGGGHPVCEDIRRVFPQLGREGSVREAKVL